MTILGQDRKKKFNKNKENSSGGWVGEIEIIEVEFKLV
jgi:hypothetical protein